MVQSEKIPIKSLKKTGEESQFTGQQKLLVPATTGWNPIASAQITLAAANLSSFNWTYDGAELISVIIVISYDILTVYLSNFTFILSVTFVVRLCWLEMTYLSLKLHYKEYNYQKGQQIHCVK